jgi:tripartite-type tricarboxylate transporter receptor subunit TctC
LPTLAWAALFAPAQTPQPLLNKINVDFNAAMGDAEVRKRLLETGAEADPGTQEPMRQRLKTELTKWEKVIRSAGIQAS